MGNLYRNFGGYNSAKAIIENDSGYIVAGVISATTQGSQDIIKKGYVCHLDQNDGTITWEFSSTDVKAFQSITTTLNGGCVMVGSNNSDSYLFKIDRTGSQIRKINFDVYDAHAHDIIVSDNQTYAVCGYKKSNGKALVMTLDEEGNMIKEIIFGEKNADFSSSDKLWPLSSDKYMTRLTYNYPYRLNGWSVYCLVPVDLSH